MAQEKTIIKYKFVKPGGFSVEGYGNHYPELKPVLDTNAPAQYGNVWVPGYDTDQVYKIEMPSETARELPAHIINGADEVLRISYQKDAAEKAAEQHALNNKVRDELEYQASVGTIEIVYDSFYDEEDPTLTPAQREAEQAVESKRRGRKPKEVK